MPNRKPGLFLPVAVLVAMFCAYLGAYVWIAEMETKAPHGLPRSFVYSIQRSAHPWIRIFDPIHGFDRRLRPDLWRGLEDWESP